MEVDTEIAANANAAAYSADLVPSGHRIKLQVEVNPDYKFLSIVDPSSTLADLKTQLELEYAELYSNEIPITIIRLQDSRRNDMPFRFKIQDLLKDKDKIYVVIKPIINPDDENAENHTTPRQRGRKRRNIDHKDVKTGPETPSGQMTPLQQQQQMQQGGLPSYSPSAKVSLPSPNAERVSCTPYCALIETRESVPCTHCGELRPYVVPDSEKTDRNQCSKWCVTGSTRKLKAAGLEFCSICVARHRAGKYDLRKAHQCIMCHRPWLHLDEYMYCRTCRKSAMGTDKEPQQVASAPIILPILSANNGGAIHHLPQITHHHPSQQIPTHLTQPMSVSRLHSPQLQMRDIMNRSEDNKLKGDSFNKTQSFSLQQLHHQFQQQSQQILNPHTTLSSPPSSSLTKDEQKDHQSEDNTPHHHTQEHHHEGHEHVEHVEEHPHAHAHAHAHAHGSHSHSHGHSHAQDNPSAEQLAEMLSHIPAQQEGESTYYDPIQQEKGS